MYEPNGKLTMEARPRQDTVRIAYDASTGSYTLSDSRTYFSTGGWFAVNPVTIQATDRVSSDNYFDIYRKQSGNATHELAVFGNARDRGSSPDVAPINLSYLSFGYWTYNYTAPATTRKTYFILGSPTSDMPVSGSASYSTLVHADSMEVNLDNEVQAITPLKGSASLEVDFSAGTVNTLLNLLTISDSSMVASFDGAGTISGANQFDGELNSTTPNFSGGHFRGGFFGPEASEMGYSFYAHFYKAGSSDPLIDTTHTVINGVVVGTKD